MDMSGEDGGDGSSWWDERCLQACKHSNAQVNNETEKEYVESIVKSESNLENNRHEGALSHPYIGERKNNCLQVLRHVIRQ